MDPTESLDLQNTNSDELDVIFGEYWFFVPSRFIWENWKELIPEEEG